MSYFPIQRSGITQSAESCYEMGDPECSLATWRGKFSSPPSPDWFAVNPTTLLAGNTLRTVSRVKRLKSLNDYSFLSSELVKSCTKFLFPSAKTIT